MQLRYLVQNPSDTTVGTRATVNGKEMTVSAPGFECDLVAYDSMQGGIKIRVIGEQVAEAKELFKADSTINVTFAQ